MNWLQLYELLDRERDRFRAGLLSDKGKKIILGDRSDLGERMGEIQRGVDLACGFFAENQKWPVIEPIMVLEILERVEEARSFAKFISCPEIPRDNPALDKQMLLSDPAMLDWILIEYWKKAGQWRRLYRIGTPRDE